MKSFPLGTTTKVVEKIILTIKTTRKELSFGVIKAVDFIEIQKAIEKKPDQYDLFCISRIVERQGYNCLQIRKQACDMSQQIRSPEYMTEARLLFR